MDTVIDQLPSRLKKLDEEAFRDFADEFGPRLRRYFLSLGSSHADAESLAVSCVSDIAVLKIDRFQDRGPGKFEAWVFRVAYHAWVDEQRGRLGPALPEEVLDEPAVEPNPRLETAVEAALAELSDGDRAVIVARYHADVSCFAEIGRQLGITESTARVRHHRAIRRLASTLAEFAPGDVKTTAD